MATTITGKLNKAANQFQAGDSTGFGIRLGVKYRDPKTKQDDWTNYQAVIFAKSPGQIQFYQQVLVKGSIVEVTAEQIKVSSFDGNNGTVLYAEMLNARLGYVSDGQLAPQQQQQQYQNTQQGVANTPVGGQFTTPGNVPQQQQYQPQQQAPQQQAPQADNFDDDIPF